MSHFISRFRTNFPYNKLEEEVNLWDQSQSSSQQPIELESSPSMASTGAASYAPAIPSGHIELSTVLSPQSTYYENQRERRSYDTDLENTNAIGKADGWRMKPRVEEYAVRNAKSGFKNPRLGVTWSNLSIRGTGADAAFHENVTSQFNVPRKIKEARRGAPKKTIIDQSYGCVKPGEMLLVLGRPGAGCTSLLKVLSNRRDGFAEIDGQIKYGNLDHIQAQKYRGQIAMNTEDEVFFPTLTVAQTMDFATRMKVPFHRPSAVSKPEQYQQEMRDFLLESMGITHTSGTKVGNEYIRGVSGGERKRVSIIECLATRGSVFCWDNSTRGLDASSALEYTRAMRAMTDVLGLTMIVTLYQAGNGIYNLFDKVLVLDEGKQIYYGPQTEARPFMEGLGFYCDPSANVADFLTGVTVPTERQIKSGFEERAPRTAAEIREEFNKTQIRARATQELGYPLSQMAKDDTTNFVHQVALDKHKSLPKGSQLTTSFATQVRNCIIRQYQIIWGDKATFIIKQGSTLVQALIAGSLFYNAPANSSGLFVKGGALFFALLYNTLIAMSETTDSFTGRPVLAKHKAFAMYHPAAFCIGQIAADIPVLLFQVSQFGIVLYFMVGLKVSAGAFFTFWIVIFSTAMSMTAFFRAVGAGSANFDAASKISGFGVSALFMYTGYMIPKTAMHPWFVWLYWIDPLAYAFQSLMDNEFHDQVIPCVANNLVPNGPTYTQSAFQSCAGVGGAVQGATSLTGDVYLGSLAYSDSHLWRNLGIVWAWWALFVGLTIYFTSNWKSDSGKSGFLLVPRELVEQNKHHLVKDEEAQAIEKRVRSGSSDQSSTEAATKSELVHNTSVFTWKNLTYTVKTPSGDRVLLDDVHGWVKPGMLGALMGSSGAGKTTLLDVLAQRKTSGTIKGSIMVDGRPLSLSFQRSAGYCEQFDVHEPMTTVREAFEFSALLRQGRDIPREQKLRYVDTIIDLLEMRDIEHTLIGTAGAGLSIEQRKRVTIGVELVSKPSILIFLDEPTSGLDGQAAFNTVRFLKKLAAVGQAVLVTIHQPSASLFYQFDSLLLLARGGKTVYFGDIGYNAATIKEYFARYSAPCPEDANPAEHMIDVVSGSLSQGRDWNKIWLESPEHAQTVQELDRIIEDAAAKPPGTSDDGREFATPLWTQIKLVTQRMNIALYRDVEYVNNKVALHIGSALFNGFSFWMIGDSVTDLHLGLFTIFNFIFVAPGVINQLQPVFIARRDIFETRESKSRMYSWWAFVTGLIVSEIPYLCICAVLYFVCWYYTVGFPSASNRAGATLFVMLMYEFVYTGIGQFVAAYAPNAVFASLVNPLIIGMLVSFCGVLVPYAQLQSFWRYWMYYLDPFTYLMGSLLTFDLFGKTVKCTDEQFAVFDTPKGETCRAYLADYLAGEGARANLVNPDATRGCRVCEYRNGSDYLYTVNLKDYYYGWRDAAIVVIFALSSYGMVYLFMKLRTKSSKKAE